MRTILHVDLDAFYASVEQRDDPALVGRPVVVGGPSMRGVVCAASYEARRYGVKSAMPVARAVALCPQAVLLQPRMAHYASVSGEFFGILARYSPLVEGLSLDEAFLDVSGAERLLGDGPTIARRIKDDVREELRLVASVGVSASKHTAKIASDLEKPDGLVVVPADQAAFLAPLPVTRLWGVGPKAAGRLESVGVRTIGDMVRVGETHLARWVGRESARHLLELASGRDDRPVLAERDPVSIGHEETFEHNLHAPDALRPHVLSQADRTCARLRRHGLRGRTVTLKVKYADHQSVTRQSQVVRATADDRVVAREALLLLAKIPYIAARGVRLTGVSVSGLVSVDSPAQLGFDEADVRKGEALGDTLDAITARFGAKITRATLLEPDEE